MSADRLRAIRQADVQVVRTALRQGERAMNELQWTYANVTPEVALDRLADLAEWAADAADALEERFLHIGECGDHPDHLMEAEHAARRLLADLDKLIPEQDRQP